MTNVAAIILGAGKGTRMKSDLPKVLMPVDGKPMIRHIIDTLEEIKADRIVTVIARMATWLKKKLLPILLVYKKNSLAQVTLFALLALSYADIKEIFW